ncbi:acanthoscurrin-1-like [Argiope bruennichi]|uniref:acanthoscurrin-1-like n=1 Tax=Argiope bruennichi TaxID=94029 RepID=UPI0024946AAB|nr:acanthoscurrin-1-like [Argiope bruennichi]
MFAKVFVICAVVVVVHSQRLGSPPAAGGYAGNRAYGGRGIGGYGSGASVASGPIGYAGRGAINSRGSAGYGSGAPVVAAPVGYSGQGAVGGRGVGGYGTGASRSIGASIGSRIGGGSAAFGRSY